jgi:hypothetical protein
MALVLPLQSMAADYAAGLGFVELGAKYGVSSTTARLRLRRHSHQRG